MEYVALLRGINVGKLRPVGMKRLKALLESLGCTGVSTYLNSGNAIFTSQKGQKELEKELAANLKKEFGFEIPTLVKTKKQMKEIAAAIPREWKNDSARRTDVAYLFAEIDSNNVLGEFPVNREYVDIRYVKGAVFWNLERKNVYKSRLNKVVGSPIYQKITLRNVNTARFLGGEK